MLIQASANVHKTKLHNNYIKYCTEENTTVTRNKVIYTRYKYIIVIYCTNTFVTVILNSKLLNVCTVRKSTYFYFKIQQPLNKLLAIQNYS